MRSLDKKVILLGHIKLKQKIMYNRAKKLGRTHPSVIICSQELDVLLNKYHNMQMADNQYYKVS